MNDLIKSIALAAKQPLKNVSDNGAKRIETFDIECSILEDYNDMDIRNSEKFNSLFVDLQKFHGPCLYYFTVTSDQSADEIVEAIKNYSSAENSKSIPAIKSNYSRSKILYVGKVKRAFWGRIIQHLGYYNVNRTQGLQLFYWAQKLNLSLKLTVLEFEPAMENLMEVVESGLAKHLQPILGKHR